MCPHGMGPPHLLPAALDTAALLQFLVWLLDELCFPSGSESHEDMAHTCLGSPHAVPLAWSILPSREEAFQKCLPDGCVMISSHGELLKSHWKEEAPGTSAPAHSQLVLPPSTNVPPSRSRAAVGLADCWVCRSLQTPGILRRRSSVGAFSAGWSRVGRQH